MDAPSLLRRDFLAFAATLAASSLPANAAALPPEPGALPRLDRALVLSGGGARGAYHAGLIDRLRLQGGISEGQPLRPYGIVCGTSIGALNGYFVATGQYELLRELWYGVAAQNVVRLKPRYAKVIEDDAGVGTRAAAATRMALGITHHDTGVMDGELLRAWMASRIDPERPAVMPLVFPVTNLSRQAAEYFFFAPAGTVTPERREAAERAIRTAIGPLPALREATPDVLVDALRASSAIPVAFDPVKLPASDGSGRMDTYVDGGVTANTPVSVARVAARNVDVVLLDPPFEREVYHNAFEIGLGVFGAMQRRILEADLRAGYMETLGKRALGATTISAQLRALAAHLFESDFFLVRPEEELPVDIIGFSERERLFETYKLGFEAGGRGFVPYALGD